MYMILVTALAFIKVNLVNVMYIVKFKILGFDIWKYCTHLIIICIISFAKNISDPCFMICKGYCG